MRLNPQHYISKYNLSSNLVEMGNFKQAEDLLRSAIKDNPIDARLYQSLASLLARQKRTGETERFFNMAISLDPNALTYMNFSTYLTSLNRYEESEKLLGKAITLNPRFGMAYFNYSVLLTKLKRYDEAILHLKKAFDLGIQNPAMGSLMKFYGIQVFQVKK